VYGALKGYNLSRDWVCLCDVGYNREVVPTLCAIKALWVDFWETMDWVQLLEQLVVFGLSCLNRRLFHS